MAAEAGDGAHQAFVKPLLPIVGACPSFAIVYLNRDTLGDATDISFSLSELLNVPAIIEQAQINGDKISGAPYERFNARKCIDWIKSGGKLQSEELNNATPDERIGEEYYDENDDLLASLNIDDVDSMSNPNTVAKSLRQREPIYRVSDLIASSAHPTRLADVAIGASLELRVVPNGVRAVKLELKLDTDFPDSSD